MRNIWLAFREKNAVGTALHNIAAAISDEPKKMQFPEVLKPSRPQRINNVLASTHCERISPVRIHVIHSSILSAGRNTMPCRMVPFLMSMSSTSRSLPVRAVLIPAKNAADNADTDSTIINSVSNAIGL